MPSPRARAALIARVEDEFFYDPAQMKPNGSS
jgi:hypothetical protein